MKPEIVYTIEKFFDCPRTGIAEFLGKPHTYTCIFSEEEDAYTDHYQLKEISADELKLNLKKAELYMDWNYHPNKSQIEKQGTVLEKDKQAHEQLKIQLKEISAQVDAETLIVKGEFRQFSQGCWRGYVVEWTQS